MAEMIEVWVWSCLSSLGSTASTRTMVTCVGPGVRGGGVQHTVQWDRVEKGRGPIKICVYFTFPNKKLCVTDGCCLCLDHDPEGVGA